MRRGKRMLENLEQEIRDHIERETQDNIERGLPPEEARYAAIRKFGNMTRVQEETREVWTLVWLEQLVQDIRFGLRMLRKSPGFTIVAAGILALAIGANTAIFSAVYALLLRPLPYANPQQLVVVFGANLKEGVKETGIPYLDFDELRAQNHVFSETAATAGHSLTLTGAGDPAEVKTEVVTPEYFSLLDVKPLLGRTFLSEDGRRGAAPVVMLSENLWRDRLGADPRILGKSITLDKRPFTVVGVMPGTFRSPVFIEDPRDIWIPMVQDPLFSGLMTLRNRPGFGILARLRPGTPGAQAQAEMDAIAARLATEWPAEDSGWTIGVVPLQKEIAGNVKTALLVLLGSVGTVLLIACVNIANLFLTRATTRAREMGIRVALGAGRNRIVRQLLTESVVLGLVGGTLGVFLAYGGVRELNSLLPSGFPRVRDIRIDGWVLGFALLLSVGAGVVFGVAPGFFAAGSDVQASLKEGSSHTGKGGVRRRTRNLLAVAEVALAMVLLVAAGLLIRSFATLTSVHPGFDADHLLKAEVSLPQFEYSTPQQWTAFSNELLTRIQTEPGMQNSAIAVPLPLADGPVNLGFEIEGNPVVRPGTSRTADYVAVSPGYFRVMQIPLLRGRLFSEQDAMPAPRVTLISEALARLYFPNQDPIGKRMTFGFPPKGKTSREIVGIVGDVRDVSLHQEPGPMMYVPYAQAPFWGAVVVARTTLSTSSAANTIRQDVRSIDKDLPVTDIESMIDALSASVAQPRFGMFLLSLFGALALILAAAGIFGVISYSVSSRTREVGIRVALGAARGKILQLILSESAKLVLLGLALGIGGAIALGRFLRSLLFEVRPTDPLTFAAVAILLALVTLAAAYVPARRAMRVDPMVALRHE
jgi:putative ABC transport system permease protein